ncbi:hypothetical protein I4U23_022485 [Adineta vaga]|nr:hypothetical protein I4U23_022485 [Adineta vaga]
MLRNFGVFDGRLFQINATVKTIGNNLGFRCSPTGDVCTIGVRVTVRIEKDEDADDKDYQDTSSPTN